MKTERTVYIAYYVGKGFRCGKAYPTFKDDFSKARVYEKRNHLSSSCGKAKIDSGDILVIPLEIKIAPEALTVLKLGGTIV